MDQSIESLIVQVAWILRTLGTTIISCHSFNVALYKYYIIVDKRPINAEDKKIKLRYLMVLILYPIIAALCIYLRNSNGMGFVFNATRFCYSEEVDRKKRKSMKELLICSFDDDDIYRREWQIIYVMSEVYCVILSIISSFLAVNIAEIFVYYKIFDFAKSQLSQAQDRNDNNPNNPDSSRSQDPGIKKLYVNAQITAIISALEGLGLVMTVLISTISAISLPWNRTNRVRSFNHEEDNNKNDIFLISQGHKSINTHGIQDDNLCLNTLDCNLNTPFEEQPSTSDNSLVNCGNNFSSESKNISKDTNVKLVSPSILVRTERTEILDRLLRAVDKEMKYLQLFAHFNYLENSKYEEPYLYASEIIDREINLQRIIKVCARNSSLSRREIRQEKLKQLKISLNDEKIYQTHLSQLIDIEEEFMND